MSQVIKCECGFIAEGETDGELLAAARAHIADAHPDLVGQVQDSDLLAMATQV
jgi:hypothetical protein